MLSALTKRTLVLGAVMVLATLALAEIPAILALITKSLVDLLVSGRSFYLGPYLLKGPLFLGCVYCALLLLQYVGNIGLFSLGEHLTEAASYDVHIAVMRAGIGFQSLRYFEDPAFHNHRAILERTAFYTPLGLVRVLIDACAVVATTVGMAVLLGKLHPLLPVLIIASGIPDMLVQRRAHRMAYEGLVATAEEERRKDYCRTVLTTSEYAGEVRLYSLVGFFVSKYKQGTQRIGGIFDRIRKQQLKLTALSGLFLSAGTMLPFLWLVNKGIHGQASLGQLAMYIVAIFVIQQQLSRAAQTMAGHQDLISATQVLADWLQRKPEFAGPSHQMLALRHAAPPKLILDNVWFKYPGMSEFTLKGINLEIPEGSSLALVGRNGCGKSTLVKLLCRLYDPDHGMILYDGNDIKRMSVSELRRSIGVIFQDFLRYELTVNENIGLSALIDQATAESIGEAAVKAGAADFIAGLPYGFDSVLGREFAEGVDLSAGQWQRVALARALFREAGLLILDEPTASLDVATEAMIYAHFNQVTAGRTSILVSHRLSTVRMADQIAVIDGGRVAEHGSHDRLMALNGIYAKMFTRQAEKYYESGVQQAI